MKSTMKILITLILLSLTCWADKLQITDVQALGALKLQMPESALEAILGKPGREGKEVLEAATGMTVKNRLYPQHGLTVTLGRAEANQGWVVERFKATAPCQLKTPQGVGIATPVARLKTLYGSLLEKETSTPSQLVVGSVYGGVIFNIQGGKVSSIFVGAAAE